MSFVSTSALCIIERKLLKNKVVFTRKENFNWKPINLLAVVHEILMNRIERSMDASRQREKSRV